MCWVKGLGSSILGFYGDNGKSMETIGIIGVIWGLYMGFRTFGFVGFRVRVGTWIEARSDHHLWPQCLQSQP